MTKQQKAYFKKHHEMYIKTLKDNPQLENVEVCLKWFWSLSLKDLII